MERKPLVEDICCSEDQCEGLVFALECSGSRQPELAMIQEKAALYTSYLDLSGLTLVEQLLYMLQKFSEYNDRLSVVDIEAVFMPTSQRSNELTEVDTTSVASASRAIVDVLCCSTMARIIARTHYGNALFLSDFENKLIVYLSSGGKRTLVVEDCADSSASFAAAVERCINAISAPEKQEVPQSETALIGDLQGQQAVEVACLVALREGGESEAALLDERDSAVAEVHGVLRRHKESELRHRIGAARTELLQLRNELELEGVGGGASLDGEGTAVREFGESAGSAQEPTRSTDCTATDRMSIEGGAGQNGAVEGNRDASLIPPIREIFATAEACGDSTGGPPGDSAIRDQSIVVDADAAAELREPLNRAPLRFGDAAPPILGAAEEELGNPAEQNDGTLPVLASLEPLPAESFAGFQSRANMKDPQIAQDAHRADRGSVGESLLDEAALAAFALTAYEAIKERAIEDAVILAGAHSVGSSWAGSVLDDAPAPGEQVNAAEAAQKAIAITEALQPAEIATDNAAVSNGSTATGSIDASTSVPSPASPLQDCGQGEPPAVAQPTTAPDGVGPFPADDLASQGVYNNNSTSGTQMRDKLLSLRAVLEFEERCERERRNRRRVEMGKAVLSQILLLEGGGGGVGAIKAKDGKREESALMDVAVRKSGVSFTAVVSNPAHSTAAHVRGLARTEQDLARPILAHPAPAPVVGQPQAVVGAMTGPPAQAEQFPSPRLPRPPTLPQVRATTDAAERAPEEPPMPRFPPPRSESAGRGGRKLSNYPLIKNAVNAVCMAGATFDIKRAQLLDLLEHFRFGKAVPSALLELHGVDPLRAQECLGAVSHFVILFSQSKSLSFKALYAADPRPSAPTYFRLFGRGPKEFSGEGLPVQQFLKFESSTKAFKQLHVKQMSANVDAIVVEATAMGGAAKQS